MLQGCGRPLQNSENIALTNAIEVYEFGDAVDVDKKMALLKQVREWDAGFDMRYLALAFDLIKSEEELRAALNDPAELLKRFMLKKLRPKLTENLQHQGLQWEEAWLRSSKLSVRIPQQSQCGIMHGRF